MKQYLSATIIVFIIFCSEISLAQNNTQFNIIANWSMLYHINNRDIKRTGHTQNLSTENSLGTSLDVGINIERGNKVFRRYIITSIGYKASSENFSYSPYTNQDRKKYQSNVENLYIHAEFGLSYKINNKNNAGLGVYINQNFTLTQTIPKYELNSKQNAVNNGQELYSSLQYHWGKNIYTGSNFYPLHLLGATIGYTKHFDNGFLKFCRVRVFMQFDPLITNIWGVNYTEQSSASLFFYENDNPRRVITDKEIYVDKMLSTGLSIMIGI